MTTYSTPVMLAGLLFVVDTVATGLGSLLLLAASLSLPAATGGLGGGFYTNTSPLAAPPFGDCPVCPDDGANPATGSCSCPPWFGLVQPLAVVSDCAYRHGATPAIENPPLRPAAIGLCLPMGHAGGSSVDAGPGGAWQQDPGGSGSGRCRSPNLITGSCSCPAGYAEVKMGVAAPRTMPADGATAIEPSTAVLCVPATSRQGFGGAYQVLDPVHAVKPAQRCAAPNPATGNCSCSIPAAGWIPAAQAFRAVAYVPGNGSSPDPGGPIVGSKIVLCTELPPAAVAPTAVELCAGVTVDTTGRTDASLGIRRCVEVAYTAGRTLALPAGTYLMHHRLNISSQFTLQTAGVDSSEPGCGMPGGPRCAVLRAAPELTDPYGLLLADGVDRLVLDHIVLDGNRGQRLETGPGISCGAKWAGHESAGRTPGYNSGVHSCSNCSFVGVASINALCGTGCEFSGTHATIERCLFQNNGDHFGRQSGEEVHKWSDGLTMTSGADAVVRGCLFQDNSDINLIIADGHGALVESNAVRMVANGAFGGIMMDNFNNRELSNHSGAVVRNNTIDGGNRVHYGIELGPRPWYTAGGNLRGPALVTNNTISGAGFMVDAGGAGLPGAPFTVTGNTFAGGCVADFACVDGTVKYTCSAINISPNSTVDRRGEANPIATHFEITACP